MTAILALIAQILPVVIQELPTAITTIGQLRTLATGLFSQLSGGVPVTADQQAAIETLITNLSNQLQAPLDPA